MANFCVTLPVTAARVIFMDLLLELFIITDPAYLGVPFGLKPRRVVEPDMYFA